MVRLLKGDVGLATAYISELEDALALMRDGVTLSIELDVSIYSDPVLVPPAPVDDGRIPEGEFAQYRTMVGDTVSENLYRAQHGLPLEMKEVIDKQSNIVVISSGQGKECYFKYPFWLGRVLKIYPDPNPEK